MDRDKGLNDNKPVPGDIIASPFKEGVATLAAVTTGVVVLVALRALIYWFRHGHGPRLVLDSLFCKIFLGIAVVIVTVSFGYAYLGTKIGRANSAKVFGVVMALVLIGGVYWMTHAFD